MKEWSFEENPFLNATAKSYALMLTISEYHLNALENGISIPEIKVLRIAISLSMMRTKTNIRYGKTAAARKRVRP